MPSPRQQRGRKPPPSSTANADRTSSRPFTHRLQPGIPTPDTRVQTAPDTITVALTVPNNPEFSRVFHPVTIPTSTVDLDNEDCFHDQAIDIICQSVADTLGCYFEAQEEIAEATRLLVQQTYAKTHVDQDHFYCLSSANRNGPSIPFRVALQQCAQHNDPTTRRTVWVYMPDAFVNDLRIVVQTVIEDRPNNDFFERAKPFLPLAIQGGYDLYTRDTSEDKGTFSDTLFKDRRGAWHCSLLYAHLENLTGATPATTVPTRDSTSHERNVANCVSTDSTQPPVESSPDQARNSPHDPTADEIGDHARALSPTAAWGHTTERSIEFGDISGANTPTTGNTTAVSQLPQDTALVESNLFASMTHDISDIQARGSGDGSSPESTTSSSGRTQSATNVTSRTSATNIDAPDQTIQHTNVVETPAVNRTASTAPNTTQDDVSTIGDERSQASRRSFASLAQNLRSSARGFGRATSQISTRLQSALRSGRNRPNPPTQVTFGNDVATTHSVVSPQVRVNSRFDPYATASVSQNVVGSNSGVGITNTAAHPSAENSPHALIPLTGTTPRAPSTTPPSSTRGTTSNMGHNTVPISSTTNVGHGTIPAPTTNSPHVAATTASVPTPTGPRYQSFGPYTTTATTNPGSGPPAPPRAPGPGYGPPTNPHGPPPGPPPSPGPPGPPNPYSIPPTVPPHICGIDWREHRVDPATIEDHIVMETHTILPWRFPRPEVASSYNHGVRFKMFISTRNAYMRAISRPRLGTDSFSLKNFLYGFPKLPKSAVKSDIFDFLSNVTRYCMGCSVYVPPPHTMVAVHNRGEWYDSVPDHVIDNWEYYDNSLYQALTMKGTNLDDTDLTKPLLYESSGYQILWRLAYIADHPRLVECHVDFEIPTQKGTDSLLAYRQAWMYYLHMQYLRGIFLSDRYFVELFIKHLHSAFNNNVKPLLLHFVRRIPVDVPVPHYFQPANILTYLTSSATTIGISTLHPLLTPREFVESRRTPTKSSTRAQTTTPIRELQTTATAVDLRQLTDDSIDDDMLLQICSLAAANPRTCDVCGASDHIVATCPRLRRLLDDPTKARRLLTAIEAGHSSRGGSTQTSTTSSLSSSLSSSRARTPPTSNRSTLVRQLQADDTDDDGTASIGTDDDASTDF